MNRIALLASLSLSLIPAWSTLAPSTPAARLQQQASIDYPVLLKDLETMQRVLYRELDGATSAESDFVRVFSTSGHLLRTGSGSYYYIPGDGPLFLLKVGASLVGSATPKSSKDEPAKERTLWEEVQDEMEGRPAAARAPETAEEFDPKRVDELRDKVLHAVGRYGTKIAQIGEDGFITVILNGKSSAGERSAYVQSTGFGTVGDLFTQYGSSSVMTIRVALRDAREYADNKIGLPELRQRAKVASYATPNLGRGNMFRTPR